ncbi:expansin-YoaJ-like [Dreissena polymorpha]|uniref:Uncharacterized protein n=1 Tax=Dreissena polymorpha TaxID=45954 RepID=A0A9D4H414_DREPO|nr:expansin-YoaJ-like [Dreissena polymorpha]KAH3829126.1 hypothetical protein DPMN_131114 [Dreissena polymorpha]
MLFKEISLILASVVTVYCINDWNVLNLYKHWSHGDGTYYGKGEGGACSLNPHGGLPPVSKHVDKLVALNNPQFFGSSSCGLCVRVHGSGQGSGNTPIRGAFTAYVINVCPECHAGSVDLAENGDGRWKVDIRAIQCPVGDSKIEYRLEGSNDWYIKLQVRNERMPSTTVEMFQPQHNVWLSLSRTSDGFWNFPNDGRVQRPIQRPIRLRLHAPNGHVLEDTVNPPWMGYQGVFPGTGVQYPLDQNLPH